jgi:transcriptional regulator with XRE-family HTH domain
MQNLAEEIGARLRSFRKSERLTQEELAFRAGLHPTYIGQLERGEKNATIDSIYKIIRALGVSFDDLFKDLGPAADAPREVAALECYDLVRALAPGEQEAMRKIIELVIQYGKA